jgi:hypothetical protein
VGSALVCGCWPLTLVPSSVPCVSPIITKADVLVGGFITLANQFWIAYQVVIMFAVLLILIVAFLPETLYPRGAMIKQGAGAFSQEKVDLNTITLKRTRQLPLLVESLHDFSDVRITVLSQG